MSENLEAEFKPSAVSYSFICGEVSSLASGIAFFCRKIATGGLTPFEAMVPSVLLAEWSHQETTRIECLARERDDRYSYPVGSVDFSVRSLNWGGNRVISIRPYAPLEEGSHLVSVRGIVVEDGMHE